MTYSIGSCFEETKVKLPLRDAKGNDLQSKWEELGVRWTPAVEVTARLSQGILPQGWTITEGPAYEFDQKKIKVFDSQEQLRATVCMQKSGPDPKAKVDFFLAEESSKVRRDSKSENGSQSTIEGTQGSAKKALIAVIYETFKATVQLKMERERQVDEPVEDCSSLLNQVDAFAAEHLSDEEDLNSLNQKFLRSMMHARTEAGKQEMIRLRTELENKLRTEIDAMIGDVPPVLAFIRNEMAKWE